jgi:hypothetical protein
MILTPKKYHPEVDDFCHQIMDVSSMEQDSSKNE